MNWLFLQLVDGAFPAGGFAHSAGLEAALAFREGVTIDCHLDELLLQAARSALPFVREACATPLRLASLDVLFDATSTSHVANRASRAQGRALASSAARIWTEHAGVQAIVTHARQGASHHAPVFGALFGALDQSPGDAEAAYLHGVVRGALSAGVRLGIVGPLEAQRIHAERASSCERAAAAAAAATTSPIETAQPSPLVELYATLHDRLDARLFQS